MRTSFQTYVFLGVFAFCLLPLMLLRGLGIMNANAIWITPPLLVISYVAAHYATRPIRELASVAQRIRDGELHARVATRLRGPWAQIAATLADLAERLESTTQHFDREVGERTEALNRKADQLRALGQVGQEVAAVLEPSALLHFVVRVMRGTFSYDLVAVVQDEGDHLVLAAGAVRGLPDVPLGRIFSSRSPETASLIEGLRGNGTISNNPTPLVEAIPAQTELTVPIRLGSRSIGGIVVQSRQDNAFDEDDVFTARTIAGQVAVALENARLFAAERQLRNLAITEERNRIARELHDTLAQGFMGILMHLRAMQGAESAQAAEVHRAQAEMLAQEGLEEARRSVWNLRPERLERRGLFGAVKDEVERIKRTEGLTVRLEISGDSDTVPPSLAAGVLRITQEALHNVLKHARARHVQVRLTVGSDLIALMITDDGVGFDPNAAVDSPRSTAGFGLRGMRERALLLDGTFRLDTAPDHGTTIHVQIPLRRGEMK